MTMTSASFVNIFSFIQKCPKRLFRTNFNLFEVRTSARGTAVLFHELFSAKKNFTQFSVSCHQRNIIERLSAITETHQGRPLIKTCAMFPDCGWNKGGEVGSAQEPILRLLCILKA
jgi:hypothetical protein